MQKDFFCGTLSDPRYVKKNGMDPDQMTTEERLKGTAQILATSLLKLRKK